MAGLSFKHIYKIYDGDVTAVEDFNLEIKDEELIVFVGPSGCGKSTTLKCFNRMNDLVDDCKIKGLIEIDGKDINKKNVDVVYLELFFPKAP